MICQLRKLVPGRLIEMDAEEIDIPATLQKPEELADDEGL